jgi:phospholipid-binding lipoprotein MlaA
MKQNSSFNPVQSSASLGKVIRPLASAGVVSIPGLSLWILVLASGLSTPPSANAATIFFFPSKSKDAKPATSVPSPTPDRLAKSGKNPIPMETGVESKEAAVQDPLEPVNRGIFAFNHQVYRFVLKPLGKVTEFILPKPVLKAVDHAFENVDTPVRVVGNLFQGKPASALKETEKLLINSTLGVGGLFKVSDRFSRYRDLPKEDIGQAFGKWGIPHGPYLVLPVLGPSSSRDLVGKAGDIALNPITWLPHATLRNSIAGGRAVEQNPSQMKSYDQAIVGAVDRYVAIREGYISYRDEAVRR